MRGLIELRPFAHSIASSASFAATSYTLCTRQALKIEFRLFAAWRWVLKLRWRVACCCISIYAYLDRRRSRQTAGGCWHFGASFILRNRRRREGWHTDGSDGGGDSTKCAEGLDGPL